MAGSGGRLRLLAMVLASTLVFAACGSDDNKAAAAKDSDGSTTTESTQAAPEKSEIVVGVPSAMTGTSAASGVLTKSVAEAWGNWVNDNGGINGHPVKVLVKDTGPDAVKALAAVRELVEQDKVLAIVGHGEPADSAFLPYLQEQKVPTIGGGPGRDDYYQHDDTWLFPLGFDAVQTNFSIPPFEAKAAGAKSMMQYVCAEVAGCAEAAKITEPVAAKLGIKYEATIKVSAASPSYTAECLALKKSGAEFAQAWVAPAGMTRVIEECVRQGVDVTWGGAPGAMIESMLKDVSKTIDLHTPTSGFPWFVDDAPVKKFRDVMGKYAKGEWQGGYGTYTWASLEMFRKVMGDASDTPTRDEVREAMFSLKGENLDGLLANKVSFTKGQKPTHWPCYFEIGLKQGELVNWHGGLDAACVEK